VGGWANPNHTLTLVVITTMLSCYLTSHIATLTLTTSMSATIQPAATLSVPANPSRLSVNLFSDKETHFVDTLAGIDTTFLLHPLPARLGLYQSQPPMLRLILPEDPLTPIVAGGVDVARVVLSGWVPHHTTTLASQVVVFGAGRELWEFLAFSYMGPATGSRSFFHV
jgi:hypothetical protein